MDNRQQKIDDARAILSFLEANPDLDIPYDIGNFNVFNWGPDENDVRSVAHKLKPFKKEFTNDYLILKREFGSASVSYYFTRGAVCEAVQIGTKKETHREPASYVEREVEVPIYDYKCPALLSPSLMDEPEPEPEPEPFGA